MKFLCGTLVVLAAVAFIKVEGFKKCNGEDVTFSDNDSKTFRKCWKDNKPEEGKKFSPCMMPCIYDKMGLVKDKKFDMDKYTEAIKRQYPDKSQEELVKGAKKCADEQKDELSMDDKCKSFRKLVMCMIKSQKEVCHPKKEDEDD